MRRICWNWGNMLWFERVIAERQMNRSHDESVRAQGSNVPFIAAWNSNHCNQRGCYLHALLKEWSYVQFPLVTVSLRELCCAQCAIVTRAARCPMECRPNMLQVSRKRPANATRTSKTTRHWFFSVLKGRGSFLHVAILEITPHSHSLHCMRHVNLLSRHVWCIKMHGCDAPGRISDEFWINE